MWYYRNDKYLEGLNDINIHLFIIIKGPDNLYKEEIAIKAIARAAAKNDFNIQGNIEQEVSKWGK